MNIKNKKEIIRLKSIQGQENKCQITIRDFPVHKHRESYKFLHRNKYSPDLIMDKLWSCKGNDSIFTSTKGFIKKKYKCPACSFIFETIHTNDDVIIAEINIEAENCFKLEISIPMVVCKSCNKKLILRKREFTDQMELALSDAFEKSKITY
ncbi:MAG: hypothetical protein K8S27_08925 [Candidatus Omnitrophica bacterium]|nr:hypothetical protein [Candidatus Omnitrophota bacterium]